MTLFEKAIVFAVNAHSGMFRKGTDTPYIVHPIEAAAIAATLTDDEEILAAAVLHDTIEDTDTTYEALEKEFGSRVARLVASESEDKRENLPAADTWRERKQETISALKNASREKQILIIADKLSNLRAIYRDQLSCGDELWQRFNQKDKKMHAWYYGTFVPLLDKLKGTPAFEEYSALVKKTFGDS